MENHEVVPAVGMDVFGSEGARIGEIDDVEGDVFLVRTGFFFPEVHRIPLSAIASCDEERLCLNVPRDVALGQTSIASRAAQIGTLGNDPSADAERAPGNPRAS